MRGPRLGARDRRALLLGAAVVLPALFFALGVRPYLRTLSDLHGRTEVQRGLLDRELQLLAGAKRYPQRLDSIEVVMRDEVPRLFGSDEITATAALAEYVGEHAARSRILVQQSETRTPEAVGGDVLALRVELRALGDLQGIMRFLRGLEAGPKLVRVESLAIERMEQYGAAGASSTGALVLTATVEGYAVPPWEDSPVDVEEGS